RAHPDPCARVRLRHTLVDQRAQCQQRMHAVLCHHGCPQPDGSLLTAEGRAWLADQPPPETAREQITVALAMVDELDAQVAPINSELRAYARRQPGCRALMGHYGIGGLTAVAILAELGDCRRFSSSREAVRYGGMDITVYASDRRRAPGHLSRQGPPALRWRYMRPPRSRGTRPAPSVTTPASCRAPGQSRVPVAGAQAAQAQLPHPGRARRGGAPAGTSSSVRAKPSAHADAPRPAPGLLPPPRPHGRPPKTERPQCFPQRDHPINHHVAGPPHSRVADRDKV